MPIARLLVETDAPDQTPEALRPARNEPANLALVVAAVADARGELTTDIARVSNQNARSLFRINA